jgi:hypothetical protein
MKTLPGKPGFPAILSLFRRDAHAHALHLD